MIHFDIAQYSVRTRSLIQTGDFPRELSKNQAVPESVRKGAKHLLRHYPEPLVVFNIGLFEEQLETLDVTDPWRETAIQLDQRMLSSSIKP